MPFRDLVADLELDLAQLARDQRNYIDHFDRLELATTTDDMRDQCFVDRRRRHPDCIVSNKPAQELLHNQLAVTDDQSAHSKYD